MQPSSVMHWLMSAEVVTHGYTSRSLNAVSTTAPSHPPAHCGGACATAKRDVMSSYLDQVSLDQGHPFLGAVPKASQAYHGSLRGGYAAAQPSTTTYCLTEIAQQPPLGGCPPIVAAGDCIDSLDFKSCISWLDHSTGADHRSRAF